MLNPDKIAAARALLLATLGGMSVWASPARARTDQACAADQITVEAWRTAIEKTRSEWTTVLANVNACVTGDAANQQALDDNAVAFMMAYRMLQVAPSSDLRQSYWDFAAAILLINAEAGFAASQHNYAVLHNATVDDPMAKYVEQNYETFMKWECRAAAQRDPRAIFNLAVRSVTEEKLPFLVQNDPKVAYRLLRRAQNDCRRFRELAPNLPLVEGPLRLVKKRLSAREIRALERELPTFDFSTVCSLS